MANQLRTINVTVANTGTESDAAQLSGLVLCGVQLPSDWTGTAAITFKGGTSATTLVPIYDNTGNLITTTSSGTSRIIMINPATICGMDYVSIVCGAQTGAKTVTLYARDL